MKIENFLSVLILLSLIWIFQAESDDGFYPSICENEGTSARVWYCKSKNFTEVPKIVRPYSTSDTNPIIVFADNYLSKIPKDLFVEYLLQANSENITTPLCVSALLFLKNNITEIEEGAFHYEPGCLKSLVLSENNFTQLPTRELESLKSLNLLTLDYNHFEKIEGNSFYHLKSLTFLSLEYCKIQIIEPYSFNGLDKLKTLILVGNFITVLEPYTFAGLPSLTDLDISYLPIHPVENDPFEGLESDPVVKKFTFLNMSGEVLQDGKPTGPLLVLKGKLDLPDNVQELPRCEGDILSKSLLSEWRAKNYSHPENDEDRENADEFERFIHCYKFTEIPQITVHNGISAIRKHIVSFNNGKNTNQIETMPNDIFTKRFLQTFPDTEDKETEEKQPLSVFVLLLGYNSIKKVEDNAFTGEPGFLRRLDLTKNDLNIIPTPAFESLKNLTHLKLSHNNFTRVPANSFKSLENLQTLEIISKKIETIEPQAFSGLPNLRTLSLAKTNLVFNLTREYMGLSRTTNITFSA